MLIATDDPVVAGHLAVAVDVHVKWFNRTHGGAPAELSQIIAVATSTARRGQTRPIIDVLAGLGDRRVMPPLALTYDQVADALQVSERTVRRLVESGALPTVHIAGAVRVRTVDVTAYLDAHLAAREAS